MLTSAGWPLSGFRVLFRCWQSRTTYDESVFLHGRTNARQTETVSTLTGNRLRR